MAKRWKQGLAIALLACTPLVCAGIGVAFAYISDPDTNAVVNVSAQVQTVQKNAAVREEAVVEMPTPESAQTPASEPPKQQPAQSVQADVVIKDKHIIKVPAIMQYPELPYGCEVTSLTMLTTYLGLPYSKLDLADKMPKDPTPPVYDAEGRINTWGDPDVGFVGNMKGAPGYAVYHKPVADLLNSVYKMGAEDLSGAEFTALKKAISQDKPVVVWTTANFKPTDRWDRWYSKSGEEIRISYMEHAVLLVGYDQQHVYVNNPFTGEEAQEVDLEGFLGSWEQFGRMAVTFRKD